MVVGQFSQDFEILVIGGGPAGYTAAFRAAELGKSVVIVDTDKTLGGRCLRNACIPTKSAHYNISKEQSSNAQQILSKSLQNKCKSLGVEHIVGHARFESEKSVQITGDAVSVVRFRRAIIATGTDTRTTKCEKCIQVEEIYDDWCPAGKTLIVGNTPDAIEAATYLQKHDVTLLAESKILPTFNPELVKQIVRPLSQEIHIVNELPEQNSFAHIILADYRPPLLQPLQLENANVKYSEQGILISNSGQTSNSKIYAAGECAGCQHNASLAIIQGRVAAENACGVKSEIDTNFVPQAIWSNPELAQCGVLDAGESVSVRWGNSGIAVALNEQTGITKIAFDPETQAILGVGIIGNGAVELISAGVLALEMGASLYDLANTAYLHPTKSELLSEAARIALDSKTN